MADVNDFGMKISQEGYDVKVATTLQLVMTSSLEMLKTLSTGQVTGSTTVAHGQTYTPIFLTSRQSGGKGGCIGDDSTTTIDATNLNIGANTVKYYLFYHQAI